MSMMENGADRGIAPSSPLFASSWMALYSLLKQELESLRELTSPKRDEAEEHGPDRPN